MTTEERVALLAEFAASQVQRGMTVGLGSGSTAEAVVRVLGRRVSAGLELTGVPTSSNTRNLAQACGIKLRELDEIGGIDLGIDGADEIDPHMNLVKGRGGALLWEKLVAETCDEFIIVASSEKLVQQLGTRTALPVEIVPYGWQQTAKRIENLDCTATLRRDKNTTMPYSTDGGHYILDCETGPIKQPSEFANRLKTITGVVDHGLFIGLANRAWIVDSDGNISEVRAPAK
jgi:ribose 5-phosphate isomerase A